MMLKKTLAVVSMAMLFLVNMAGVRADEDLESRFLNLQYTKKVSMDFKDAALIDVLKIFSQQSGMNFIAAEDVSAKKVTLFFENIPVEEALSKILDANALTYDIPEGSNIFVVRAKSAAKVITKVYALKYATVPSSKLNSTISISSASSSDSSSSSSDSSSSSSSSDSSSSSATASSSGTGLFSVVKGLLSSTGILVEDPRTNSLIITDEEGRFILIEEAIAKLDVPIPQILIEVEMLDVSKGTSDLIGVKYGNTPLTFKGGERDVIYPWDQNMLLNKGYTFADPEYRVGTVSAAGMTATLQFLRTKTDTRNLARPRLMTMNNETAEIKISTNEAIGIATVTDSSQSTSSQSVQAERVQTGVFLTVTPQANLLTKDILMAVYPKVIQARSGITLNGQTFKDPEERGSQSILKVKDGETIVIGGLIRTDNSNTVTKVPILGDIPILGAAFRHKDKTGSERELIIFITPHIMSDLSKEEESDLSNRNKQIDRDLSVLERKKF